MNLEQILVIGASMGISYPYAEKAPRRKGSFSESKRSPKPCVTDQAYIDAELKRQKRIQRNIKNSLQNK